MKNKIINLTKKLISIKSTQDNKKGLENILKLSLSELKNFKIEIFEKNGIKSALIYNTPKRPDRFKILLNAHLDVIPGKDNQYISKIKSGKLYGVGAMDMKSAAACMIFAFKEIANKVNYPLCLQLVTDEEIGGFNGTKYQIDRGVRADFVIVGESTNLNIENKSKGILWVKVSAKGISAHGAYPWKGENAIWKMKKFLDLLEKKYPALNRERWTTTVNLSRIETHNQAFNKIPDDCTVWLDIRYIPTDSKKIVKYLKKLLPPGFKLEIVVNEPAQSTDEKNKYLIRLKKSTESLTNKKVEILSAHGSSDLRHYSRVNCEGVEFGPVGRGMGSDDEWVNIQSLGDYFNILKSFIIETK